MFQDKYDESHLESEDEYDESYLNLGDEYHESYLNLGDEYYDRCQENFSALYDIYNSNEFEKYRTEAHTNKLEEMITFVRDDFIEHVLEYYLICDVVWNDEPSIAFELYKIFGFKRLITKKPFGNIKFGSDYIATLYYLSYIPLTINNSRIVNQYVYAKKILMSNLINYINPRIIKKVEPDIVDEYNVITRLNREKSIIKQLLQKFNQVQLNSEVNKRVIFNILRELDKYPNLASRRELKNFNTSSSYYPDLINEVKVLVGLKRDGTIYDKDIILSSSSIVIAFTYLARLHSINLQNVKYRSTSLYDYMINIITLPFQFNIGKWYNIIFDNEVYPYKSFLIKRKKKQGINWSNVLLKILYLIVFIILIVILIVLPFYIVISSYSYPNTLELWIKLLIAIIAILLIFVIFFFFNISMIGLIFCILLLLLLLFLIGVIILF